MGIMFLLLAVACSGTTVTANDERVLAVATEPSPSIEASLDEASSDDGAEVSDAPAAPSAKAAAVPEPTPTPHPIAVADTELPPAPIGFDNLLETAPSGPQPVSIQIEDIGVSDATIIPVGVNAEDLSFEVPPADQVGWYEFGPVPGEAGSAVLAAHIAFDGVDGVFRYLENVEIGAMVSIGFDDGSSQRYRIEEVTEYVKEALPESLWARNGKEQLALITCGGAFNRQLNSYESNTVAIAVPL